jgi:thiol:disulfide interchange protein DsbC
MKKILAERNDIAFYFKMVPLKSHPAAYEKSKTILCEKSLSLLEDAFEKKPLPKPTCETTAVDESMKLAERLGMTSVPASILPDGQVIRGYLEAKEFLQKIVP